MYGLHRFHFLLIIVKLDTFDILILFREDILDTLVNGFHFFLMEYL